MSNLPANEANTGAAYGLKRRVMGMILLPLTAFTVLGAWVDYTRADDAATLQDRQLLSLSPLLADSIIALRATPASGTATSASASPTQSTAHVMLVPAVSEFLSERVDKAGYRLTSQGGEQLAGDTWIEDSSPRGKEPELRTEIYNGTSYRIISRTVNTPAGIVVAQLADGSAPEQQWVRSVLLKVLLPNVLLGLAAFFAIGWALDRAFKPLTDLRREVQQRAAHDVSPLAGDPLPFEVRPLVDSLNRLFGTVRSQADSQRRFVADAAHQLRTPLAALQAQVEAWAQAPAHGGAVAADVVLSADQLEHLLQATRRTTTLANQLLALSRADSQAIGQHNFERLQLRALCEEVFATHLDAAGAKGIDLGLEAADATVLAQDWLLRELISNLLDNAIKYTQPTPRAAGGKSPTTGDTDLPKAGCASPVARITLRCGTLDGRGFVEVEDNGPGIAAPERSKVTQRFYRVKGTSGVGNGLGLAIADEIARSHDSALYLEAPKACGSAQTAPGLRVGLQLTLV